MNRLAGGHPPIQLSLYAPRFISTVDRQPRRLDERLHEMYPTDREAQIRARLQAIQGIRARAEEDLVDYVTNPDRRPEVYLESEIGKTLAGCDEEIERWTGFLLEVTV